MSHTRHTYIQGGLGHVLGSLPHWPIRRGVKIQIAVGVTVLLLLRPAMLGLGLRRLARRLPRLAAMMQRLPRLAAVMQRLPRLVHVVRRHVHALLNGIVGVVGMGHLKVRGERGKVRSRLRMRKRKRDKGVETESGEEKGEKSEISHW